MQISTSQIVLIVVSITIVFLIAGGFLLSYIVLYNAKKKRHLEEKVQLKTDFDQELVKTQMEVQEQTLETIGRELHDNIGQLLSLIRITLSTIKTSEMSDRDTKKISNSLEYLNISIGQLRQLATVLHAENLLSTGLENALRNEVERLSVSEAYIIKWHFENNRQVKIDPQKELIAFRIVQEIINNSIKHSNASVINFRFKSNAELVTITIEDNGQGFELNEVLKQRKGLGMQNLIKRANMIDGELLINSVPSVGTTIQLNFNHLDKAYK